MTTFPDKTGITWTDEAGGIWEYTLDANRLRILLHPQPGTDVVALMVTYNVGSRNESSDLTGATHFLEHLMFKGTERFNRKKGSSIFQTLQSIGAQVNASTWLDRTNYYSVLPSEHLGLAVDVESDRMRHALISDEDVESERTVILNELDRGENEPLRKLYQMLWSTAFVAHPYRHPTIGWRSIVENLKASDLRAFYDRYYWPNNATVSVIGDFEPNRALDLLIGAFGHISSSDDVIPDSIANEPVQNGRRFVEVKQAGEMGAVMLAFHSPAGLHADADALDLLARVLASGRNSRLHKALTDKGITTSVHSSVSRLRDPGLFLAYAMLAQGSQHEQVEEIIRDEIEAIREGGITESERRRALAKIRAEEAFGRDGPYAMAAQLNETIAMGDWRLFVAYEQRMQSVTRECVQRVADSYLRTDKSTAGWYNPA